MKGSTVANGADHRASAAKSRDHDGLTRDDLLSAYRLMLRIARLPVERRVLR